MYFKWCFFILFSTCFAINLPEKFLLCESSRGKYITRVNDQHIGYVLRQGRHWEEDLVNFCLTQIREGSVVIDIGANIGTHTIPFAKKAKKVYSFEPQRLIYQQMCANLLLNDVENVYAYQIALGHVNKKANLDAYVPPVKGFSNRKKLNYNNTSGFINFGGVQLGKGGEEVEMRTLDSFCLEDVSLIKIDIEGAEPLALYGGQKTIEKNRPVIVYEKRKDLGVSKNMISSLKIDSKIASFDIESFIEKTMPGVYEKPREIFPDNWALIPIDPAIKLFTLDYPQKKSYTAKDFQKIEKILLEKKDLSYLEDLYSKQKQQANYRLGYLSEFLSRIYAGFDMKLLDKNGQFSSLKEIKIGKGGKDCIVSYASYNDPYPTYIKELPALLEKVGFNGMFIYQIGGYPTPNGEEIKYLGIPYAFKIFMMQEACKRGYSKVVWIDSAIIPNRDPKPLFEWLGKNSILISGPKLKKNQYAFHVLPIARQAMIDVTNLDVLNGYHYCRAGVFGMNMDSEEGSLFLAKYMELLEKVTPFFTGRPEQFVYMSIVHSIFGKDYKHHPYNTVVIPQAGEVVESQDFFYRR